VPEWQWGSPATLLVADYSVGKSWSTEFKRLCVNGHQLADVHAAGRVAARELATVPAGRFETCRVEIRGATGLAEGASPFEETDWVDTASGKPVRCERRETRPDGRRIVHQTGELLSFENGDSPARDQGRMLGGQVRPKPNRLDSEALPPGSRALAD
jgi:hypothetical protein